MTRLKSHVAASGEYETRRRWLWPLRRGIAKVDSSVLWSAAVMLASLISLVYEVSCNASDQLIGNDAANVLSPSTKVVNADRLPDALTAERAP